MTAPRGESEQDRIQRSRRAFVGAESAAQATTEDLAELDTFAAMGLMEFIGGSSIRTARGVKLTHLGLKALGALWLAADAAVRARVLELELPEAVPADQVGEHPTLEELGL